MFATVTHAARDAAKRTAFGFVSLLFLVIGIGFFSIAAWVAIVAASDVLTAALVLGAAYVGLGLICAAVAVKRTRVPLHAVPPAAMTHPTYPAGNAAMVVGIAEALTAGIAAGQSTRQAMSRPKPNGADDPHH
ncbi:hypothetical protein [Mesobacterium pallidum]|uniref:hypothetical protein n=1 Tax=Mesobacterium pallidum TaxID=2872037 RepID=UPI001EE27041|nr:hypothetical protein [Mesobacterium pallidum]